MEIEQYLDVLGRRVRDFVTGFGGTATAIEFNLYGCIQVAITPNWSGHEKEENSGHWIDYNRLATFGLLIPEPIDPDLSLSMGLDEPAAHLDRLGYLMRDTASDFQGVCTMVMFTADPSVIYTLTPLAKNNKTFEDKAFGTARVAVIKEQDPVGPVMSVPDFTKAYNGEDQGLKPPTGAVERPSFMSGSCDSHGF